jgi:acylphosphatase
MEALLQGDPAAVEVVVEWARRGPSFARVSTVDVEPAPAAPLQGFARAPTA